MALLAGIGVFLYRQMTSPTKPTVEETDRQLEKENAIKGQWKADDDFYCDIWRDGDGVFHADVTLTEGEDVVSFWECSGNWVDGENGFTYKGGKRTRYDYGARESKDEQQILYDDGGGLFYLRSGVLFWNDEKEGIADGKSFSYVGEY